jgi:hypothetical protein
VTDTRPRTEEDSKRRRFFAWKRQHPSQSEDASAVWDAAWQAGAWDAIRRNTELGLNLSNVVQRLEELTQSLHRVDIEREIEHASAYWHNDQEGE